MEKARIQAHKRELPQAFWLRISWWGILLLFPSAQLAKTESIVQNYLYVSAGNVPGVTHLLNRSDIAGIQVVYTWKSLEPARNRFDFSTIDRDLATAQTAGKKLFIQLQDRFFTPDARSVPRYLLIDPVYRGGIVPQIDNPGEHQPPVAGWVAEQWNSHVRQRFQVLLRNLAAKFDGRVYGLNLPETAIDIDTAREHTGFSCNSYYAAEKENAAFARKVFHHSFVVQYINFWPCEWDNSHRFMSRFFAFASENGIGLGGPDLVPNGKGQMHNSYPFFSRYKGRLKLVGIAVQEPDAHLPQPE